MVTVARSSWRADYHGPVWTVELSWSDWRAIITALRESGIDYNAQHAEALELRLEAHGPEEATVQLSLNDDLFLRSVNWAIVTLGYSSSVYRRG